MTYAGAASVGELCLDGADDEEAISSARSATWTPVSCGAIVADAIGQKAFKDGSSSGQPRTDENYSAAKGWVGGVHDAESGEFAYAIKTDGTLLTALQGHVDPSATLAISSSEPDQRRLPA